MENKKQDENSLEELSKAAYALQKCIVAFGNELSKALDDIKELKKEEDTWEMKCPYKIEDEYWIICDSGEFEKVIWNDHNLDKEVFKAGNAFPTKQAARLEAKRRNLLTRFKAFRDECNNGWEPIFGKECKTSKFFIGYSWDSKDEQYKLKSLELGSSNLFHQFGYFKNREDCDKAIELFGDEIKELFVEKRLANENN